MTSDFQVRRWLNHGILSVFSHVQNNLDLKETWKQFTKIEKHLDPVVQKPVNVNPGLNVNWTNFFLFKNVFHL